MTLKKCTCGKIQTTQNAKFLGPMRLGGVKFLLFNCQVCKSTFTFFAKEKVKGAA